MKLKIALHDDNVKPFFIVSAGRSGTTLLRRMLITHPLVHIPPESNRLIATNAHHFVMNNSKSWDDLVTKILDSFEKDVCFKYWNFDLSIVKESLMRLPKPERSYARIIADLYQLHGRSKGKKAEVWGDKTPILIYHLKALKLVFPEAKFIHMVRDGRAVVSSLMRHLNYTLEQATTRWKDSVHLFSEYTDTAACDDFLQIRYEDFLEDTEAVLRRICDFLSISFFPEMLHTIHSDMGDTVMQHHANVLTPLVKDPISEWRGRMTGRQYAYLTDIFQKELKALNYL